MLICCCKELHEECHEEATLSCNIISTADERQVFTAKSAQASLVACDVMSDCNEGSIDKEQKGAPIRAGPRRG